MANVDKRMGFNPISSGGRETRRIPRNVDSSNGNAIAPGDAYFIEADGNVTRVTVGTSLVNGICEAIELQGVDQGPMSRAYLPANVAGVVIGIEDEQCEFECTASEAIAVEAYDAGAMVDVVDTAPDATLAQSRQAIGAVGGDQLKLIRPVDRVGNDKYAQFASVIVKLVPTSVA